MKEMITRIYGGFDKFGKGRKMAEFSHVQKEMEGNNKENRSYGSLRSAELNNINKC